VANLNREIVPEAVVTLRESLRDAGLSEDVAVELEMHIKESVHLQRCELLDGYLRWRMAFEIERGVDESLMVDTLSRARDACLTVYPQAAAIWIKTPSTGLSISEAHVSVRRAVDENLPAERQVRRTSSPSMKRLDGLEVRRTGKNSSAARLMRQDIEPIRIVVRGRGDGADRVVCRVRLPARL